MKIQTFDIVCPGCGSQFMVEFNILDLTLYPDTVREAACDTCKTVFMVKSPAQEG